MVLNEDNVDVLDLLETPEKLPANNSSTFSKSGGDYASNGRSKNKRINMWDKTDITPKKINPEEFQRSGKSFTFFAANGGKTIPEDTLNLVYKLIKLISGKGYTFRNGLAGDDPITQYVHNDETIDIESHVPFKKFNPEAINPLYTTGNPEAYSKAANLHKSFLTLSPVARVMYANYVATILGSSTTDPVDFILIYTECGSEALPKKDINWEHIGNTYLPMRLGYIAGIPIINVKNTESIKKLNELLK